MGNIPSSSQGLAEDTESEGKIGPSSNNVVEPAHPSQGFKFTHVSYPMVIPDDATARRPWHQDMDTNT